MVYMALRNTVLTTDRNHHEKTIEGDLFAAFVAAGAISKANADDPKKSSLIRCARTDKGVHAAGNLISLKLIIEDSNIVAKINEKLGPQIRVWGIERTNGSFSAYQFCDSRIYEYLIPTHCFLPPHPRSFLAKKLEELAGDENDLGGYHERQEEVADFWSQTEEKYMKPVLHEIDPSLRDLALRAFYEHDIDLGEKTSTTVNSDQKESISNLQLQHDVSSESADLSPMRAEDKSNSVADTSKLPEKEKLDTNPIEGSKEIGKELTPLELAIRSLKAAQIKAKKGYRIHPDRLARVSSSLSRFAGSHKYHNYTVDKGFKDPSATRIIKSFVVGETPIIINNTEWLSLKVHGQSFMMHQIRKMVSMVALLVRCGCHEGRLQDSYTAERFSIPKAPSLGLLLERPVFDIYNEKLEEFGREKIDFGRYEKEMEEFKQREIYERIFREEERDNTFHTFFSGLDNTRSAQLLYLSSTGVEATKREVKKDWGKEPMGKTDIAEVSSEDEAGDRDEG